MAEEDQRPFVLALLCLNAMTGFLGFAAANSRPRRSCSARLVLSSAACGLLLTAVQMATRRGLSVIVALNENAASRRR